jgi:hypothetical protein
VEPNFPKGPGVELAAAAAEGAEEEEPKEKPEELLGASEVAVDWPKGVAGRVELPNFGTEDPKAKGEAAGAGAGLESPAGAAGATGAVVVLPPNEKAGLVTTADCSEPKACLFLPLSSPAASEPSLAEEEKDPKELDGFAGFVELELWKA